MKRVIWTFLCGALCAFGVQAALQNEWTFESDPDGRPLPEATNAVGAAQFAGSTTNFQSTVFTSNRKLLCVGEATNTSSAWINGAVMDAALALTSGVYYLRYDVAYDLSTNENSGTVLGVYFTGAGGGIDDRAAGLVIGYDKVSLASSAPARRPVTKIINLATNGTLIAIAEVNLGASPATLKVWYSVNGSAPADYSNPAAYKTNLSLTAISNLCFHATGNFQPAGSTNYAAVDNIRMADTWEDITAKVPDFSKGPELGIAQVIITTSKGTFTNANQSVGTVIGETNTVEIILHSLGSDASNVTSSVIAAANPGYSSIISNNPAAAVLQYPRYVTNTFSVVLQTNAPNDASYTFNVGATADGFSGVSTNFTLTAGALVGYKSNSISVVSTTGILPYEYEPGEILEITVYSKNDGTRPVTNVNNSLSADPAYFSITNLTSTNYPVMGENVATSTVYQVTILNAATNGTHWFSVTNRIPSLSWPASFPIRVFKQGAPLVSPASITISNLIGTITNNTEVAVTNAGNDAFTFNITDDAVWDVSYEMTTGTRGSLDFVTAYNAIALNKPTNTFYSSTNAGVSAATSIGFNFPFYGTTYSNFYVTADGYIGLVNAATNIPGISADRTAPLPSKNMTPLIAPFWGTLLSPTGTVRMIRQYDYLVISYTGVSKDGGGTNLQFQAALFTNGCIELRYKNITGITAYGQTNVTIGIQNNAGGPLYEFGGYAHKRHFGAADSANGSVGDLRDADHRHRSAEFRGDQIHC